ncbi:MAG: glycoside-pentoside-hexuronide (GPH):cation symporter [Lachnospiraceae bacterium]|nr:glycoside-pentoside-hexuronide (GPH):cation symporter [Lachnospiraceae bacterium]
MEEKKTSTKVKLGYGIGAVGKDMVYMLSASYILYYYQDLLKVPAWIMGIILLAARVFDAFNDPIMGVIVAKTKTKWGKFRPWLLIGTLINAVILYFMFACPVNLSGSGLVAYAAFFYIMWGVTYTMMDIPFWSMVPALTDSGKERESLSAFARSAAGVGSALITIITMLTVTKLGTIFGNGVTDSNSIEIIGFKYFALIVAVIFAIFTIITCLSIKENPTTDMETASVKDMFKALIENDQAMIIVATIVLVNTAIYFTSNLLIYFFKYDLAGANWKGDYTLFNTFGGGMQIIAMMLLFPLMRKFLNTYKMFIVSIVSSMFGYLVLLALSLLGVTSVYVFFVPAFFIFGAVGVINVLITIFLANTVDYGELKNNRRDESVIFSMQTFVVKLASGLSAFLASLTLQIFNISEDENAISAIAGSSVIGLRMTMTLFPMIGLIIAVILYVKKFTLDDDKIAEISAKLRRK